MSRRAGGDPSSRETSETNDTAVETAVVQEKDGPDPDRGLPQFHHHGHKTNHNGHKVMAGIHPDGESGRGWIHPWHFMRICFRSSSRMSMIVNVLWPVVPAAIAIHFARPDWHLAIFILNYIAMVPAANTIGFAGQELARKMPKVFGIILETTLGSVVEIVLFMVLIVKDASPGFDPITVIKAAILGSILANLLLCLGACFFVGGLKREEQVFHDAVGEVGSGLMLVAGMALVVPAAFGVSLQNTAEYGENRTYGSEILSISRGTAIILFISYFVYVWFQARSHHGLYDEVFEQDELKDRDRQKDLTKDKLTLFESLTALAISITCVSMIAVFLVEEIHFIVEARKISDSFIGLILVPLVEKAAEHLTAVDEAYDNQMNFALAHVLGACIQTALLNTPLVVFVGWGLGKGMDLQFETFDAIVLILAIAVVGSFLRDGKSNYLEGWLCVAVYVIIAVSAFYYPNPQEDVDAAGGETVGSSTAEAVARATAEAARRLLRV
ncbi:putative vacuolar cation/proton exchanger 2 [Saccharata proteae CBS 121410]|uniref:Vacuolar calcium ion transporter n=1 Tax=Saccharata proteae CBS 121410 TaxID=1314787 RepID=A0A9P4I1S9_9PEZI|nr:putative vacuolar cation/proton exchanger 2 [Saccharata proteae CBS 121410]